MQCSAACIALLVLLLILSLVASKNGGHQLNRAIDSHQRRVREAPLELCERGSIGSQSDSSCVNCFCNGFSDVCNSDAGWYQAKVEFSSNDLFEMSRFSSNGIKEESENYLSVRPSPDSQSTAVYLSFPPDFLGDKRTSYGQRLTLNLSVVGEEQSLSQCLVTLELESGLSIRTRHKLRKTLPAVGQEPIEIEILLVAGEFVLDRYYFRRQATQMDVRKTLADIRVMRLSLSCIEPHSLRLFSSAINFATSNSSLDGPAQQPLEEVNYVERCTCPSNRIGANCETCAPGYTTDPPFGGEFALCVRCFCSFHSSTCDPVSGMCSNCTGNTMGRDCEQCVEGYDRAQPLTILPCDQCADGYWNSGVGVCTPCNCHFIGSSSPVCDKSSGVCECVEGFTGDRCDACSPSSSGTFPNCELCGDCTAQWEDRISSLAEQVESTIDFISSLNLTNETSVGIVPEIETLLELVDEIKAVLNGSMIDALASGVNSTHLLICSLLDQTNSLIRRAREAESRIQSFREIPPAITEQLELITLSLSQLEMQFRNLSLTFDQGNFSSINYTDSLLLARTALERSNSADLLIRGNVTALLSQITNSLNTYNETLLSSNFELTQVQLNETLDSISDRMAVFRAFIAESNRVLCGADNRTEVNCTLECGGVMCPTCGGVSCDSLYSDSFTALNVSETAVRLAEEVLESIQAQVDELESFFTQVNQSRFSAANVESSANETRERANELLLDLQRVIGQVESELNISRIDPQEIGRRENFTLALQHDLLPDEFLDLLFQINSTINAFLSQANVSEEDLRERVEVALERARRSEELAQMIVSNATVLEDQLLLISTQQVEAESVANDTEQLVVQAGEAIEEAVQTLDSTEDLLGTLDTQLTSLVNRLDSLQALIDQNHRELAIARNLTSTAVQLTNQTQLNSLSAEEEFEVLRGEAQSKYEQSVEDLQVAQDIQNRTAALQRLTQDQLLQVENLERIRRALFVEQEEIRSDVGRVAIELERLDQSIQVHIARNTACLDTGVLSKKRRKRRSLRKSSV